jgi:hypothetical protein
MALYVTSEGRKRSIRRAGEGSTGALCHKGEQEKEAWARWKGIPEQSAKSRGQNSRQENKGRRNPKGRREIRRRGKKRRRRDGHFNDKETRRKEEKRSREVERNSYRCDQRQTTWMNGKPLKFANNKS